MVKQQTSPLGADLIYKEKKENSSMVARERQISQLYTITLPPSTLHPSN